MCQCCAAGGVLITTAWNEEGVTPAVQQLQWTKLRLERMHDRDANTRELAIACTCRSLKLPNPGPSEDKQRKGEKNAELERG